MNSGIRIVWVLKTEERKQDMLNIVAWLWNSECWAAGIYNLLFSFILDQCGQKESTEMDMCFYLLLQMLRWPIHRWRLITYFHQVPHTPQHIVRCSTLHISISCLVHYKAYSITCWCNRCLRQLLKLSGLCFVVNLYSKTFLYEMCGYIS